MNLSLNKILSAKKGQGSIVALVLAGTVGAVLIGSITTWYLTMHKNINGLDNHLEAMTIAMSEWERLQHMSLDELEANRENYKNPYDVGDYKVSVNLGAKGYFSDGKCGATIPSGKYANCFQDTTMTIYNSSGEREYTTRTLPLMAGLYTREEIDEMLKHYVKNDDATNQISMKYDPDTDSVKLYVNGQEKSLDLHDRYVRNPDMNTRTLMKNGNNFTETIPFDGFLEINFGACCCSTYVYLNDNLVAGTYNSETTNRSQADTTFIHVKAGDKIRAETYSYSHANSNTVNLYMYTYK